jgi:hypothetical protein
MLHNSNNLQGITDHAIDRQMDCSQSYVEAAFFGTVCFKQFFKGPITANGLLRNWTDFFIIAYYSYEALISAA